MWTNDGQSVKGDQNVTAGRDINIYGLGSLSEEVRKRLKDIEERINSRFPKGFVSPSRNDKVEPFSCDRLLESLLFVGIPLGAALSIVEQIEVHLTKVLRDVEIPTTHHIRQAVAYSIYALDMAKFGAGNVQKWGDRYARQYGNPDFRTKVLYRDGETAELSHRFLKEEFFPHLLEDAFGVSYRRLKNRVIPRSQIDEMAETVIAYVRTMNFYQIRYKTLYNLVYDIAVQPPHPWFAVESAVQDIVAYDLGRAQAHARILLEEDSEQCQQVFHSIGECLHHSSSAILAIYGNFIGSGYLTPLLNLVHSLKMFQFRGESVLLEFCDFRQIEGDLEAIELSVDGFLRRLSLAKERFHAVRSTFSLSELKALKQDVLFILEVAEKLVEARRRYKKVEPESILKSPERLVDLAVDVFARIPTCKVVPDALAQCGENLFYVQHNIDSAIVQALKSPLLLIAVFPNEDMITLPNLERIVSCVQQEIFSRALMVVVPYEEAKEVVRQKMKEVDANGLVMFAATSIDLVDLYHTKDRREGLESLLLRTRLQVGTSA